MQNPYPDTNGAQSFKWNDTLGSEFPIASDINPGITGTTDNVLSVQSTSSAREMKLANSNNHDKDGQNVLFGDGHVDFVQNPFAGTQKDHIFCRRSGTGVNQLAASWGTGSTGPFDGNDSVLLPTDDF